MKRKICCVFIIVMFVSFFINCESFAQSSDCKLQLEVISKADSEKTVHIVLKVDNVNNEIGIAGISGLLEYDKEVMELVRLNPSKEWNRTTILEDTIFGATTNLETIKQMSQVCTIEFKIKSDAKPR